MKVIFKREGGFAGLSLKRETAAEDLPEAAGRALNALGEISRAGRPHSTRRRDAFLYTIQFEHNGRPVVVALSEEQVPEAIVPLIQYFETSS